MGKATAWWKVREGDLVLVRRHKLDKQHGRKLESRWMGPKLVVRVIAKGNSIIVKELHDVGTEKRYHSDDIELYVARKEWPLCKLFMILPNTRLGNSVDWPELYCGFRITQRLRFP